MSETLSGFVQQGQEMGGQAWLDRDLPPSPGSLIGGQADSPSPHTFSHTRIRGATPWARALACKQLHP